MNTLFSNYMLVLGVAVATMLTYSTQGVREHGK